MKAGARGPYAAALDDGLAASPLCSRPNRRLRASSHRPATIVGDLSRVHPTAVSRLGCRANRLAAPHPRFETCDRTGGSERLEDYPPLPAISLAAADGSCGSASRISATTSSSRTTPGTRTNPWRHWNQWDRIPPYDIAAMAVPALSAYDFATRTFSSSTPAGSWRAARARSTSVAGRGGTRISQSRGSWT